MLKRMLNCLSKKKIFEIRGVPGRRGLGIDGGRLGERYGGVGDIRVSGITRGESGVYQGNNQVKESEKSEFHILTIDRGCAKVELR